PLARRLRARRRAVAFGLERPQPGLDPGERGAGVGDPALGLDHRRLGLHEAMRQALDLGLDGADLAPALFGLGFRPAALALARLELARQRLALAAQAIDLGFGLDASRQGVAPAALQALALALESLDLE